MSLLLSECFKHFLYRCYISYTQTEAILKLPVHHVTACCVS